MKFPESAVTVNQQQMDVFDEFAEKLGSTGGDLVRAVLKRVVDGLEQAQSATDPAHNSFASVLPAVRSTSNVVRLPVRG
jgi:hypothetical protein